MAKVDLHVHSNYSDGSDTVEELAKNLLRNGIKIFALTDHDTVDGCREITKFLDNDITFIPSIELTCDLETVKCHILGLHCNIDDIKLNNLIKKGRVLRKNKLEKRIEFLKEEWGIELTKEESDWLHSRNSVVKTHIANILVNRGLSDNNVDAMKKYLDGCKTPNSRFDGKEGIEAILSAGGIPVWAHPLGGEGEKHIDPETFYKRLEVMKRNGIMGLECYYSRYNFEEIEFLVNVANENGLFISGGSDYHGTNKTINLCRLNTENKYIDSDKLTVLKKIFS